MWRHQTFSEWERIKPKRRHTRCQLQCITDPLSALTIHVFNITSQRSFFSFINMVLAVVHWIHMVTGECNCRPVTSKLDTKVILIMGIMEEALISSIIVDSFSPHKWLIIQQNAKFTPFYATKFKLCMLIPGLLLSQVRNSSSSSPPVTWPRPKNLVLTDPCRRIVIFALWRLIPTQCLSSQIKWRKRTR